jgi:hypothetical protein
MRQLITAIVATVLGVTLAGCTATVPAEPQPHHVGFSEDPAEEQRMERAKVCAKATIINTSINDADWLYTQQSISADAWLTTLLDAQKQADRLADLNSDEPYALAVREYSAMVSDFDEVPPSQPPSRDWERAALFVEMCEAASAAYGGGGGGAVGG